MFFKKLFPLIILFSITFSNVGSTQDYLGVEIFNSWTNAPLFNKSRYIWFSEISGLGNFGFGIVHDKTLSEHFGITSKLRYTKQESNYEVRTTDDTLLIISQLDYISLSVLPRLSISFTSLSLNLYGGISYKYAIRAAEGDFFFDKSSTSLDFDEIDANRSDITLNAGISVGKKLWGNVNSLLKLEFDKGLIYVNEGPDFHNDNVYLSFLLLFPLSSGGS